MAYPLTIKPNKYFTRNDFQIFLEKKGIQTRPVFTGNILRQPAFRKIKYIGKKTFKNADFIMKNSVLLACHHGLKKSDILYIQKNIDTFIRRFKG